MRKTLLILLFFSVLSSTLSAVTVSAAIDPEHKSNLRALIHNLKQQQGRTKEKLKLMNGAYEILSRKRQRMQENYRRIQRFMEKSSDPGIQRMGRSLLKVNRRRFEDFYKKTIFPFAEKLDTVLLRTKRINYKIVGLTRKIASKGTAYGVFFSLCGLALEEAVGGDEWIIGTLVDKTDVLLADLKDIQRPSIFPDSPALPYTMDDFRRGVNP